MKSDSDKQTAILVFGMHRSGTSATTRVLNLLGAELNDRVVEPRFDNPKGFWESAEAVDVHDRLLRKLSRSWSDVRPLPAGWMQLPVARAAMTELTALIERDFSGKALWVVKDPRMCLLAPLWLEALAGLGINAKALFIVRNPLEVAQSLHLRNHLGYGHAAMMWMRHVIEPERATRNMPRVMITYDQVLHDWRSTMTRVSKGLEIDWPHALEDVQAEIDSFLDKDDRHHSSDKGAPESGESSLPVAVVDAYGECVRIAVGGHDWRGLQALGDEFADAADTRMAGLLNAALIGAAQSNNVLERRLDALDRQLRLCERKADDFEQLLGGVYRSVERLNGEGRGERASDSFYAEYYFAKYPDVAGAGYDAYEHFLAHGKAEGRFGAPPQGKPTKLVAQELQAFARQMIGHEQQQLFRDANHRIAEMERQNSTRFADISSRIESLTQSIDANTQLSQEYGRLLHSTSDRITELECLYRQQATERKDARQALDLAQAKIAAAETAEQAARMQLQDSGERLRALTLQQQQQLDSLGFLVKRLIRSVARRLTGKQSRAQIERDDKGK